MILTPPRIIVVDDKPEHLTPIVEAFQNIGAPCLGLLYDPEGSLDRQHFSGVRILFMDLNLLPSPISTDPKPQFSEIASILDSNIHQHNGPFALVVWTEHEDHVEQLIEYLDHPATIRPFARPLAILGLPKGRFIDLVSGRAPSLEPLVNEIRQGVLQSAPLAALLSWETEVLAASGETLASLIDLVPDAKRTKRMFSGELQVVLGHLASSSVGEKHVHTDPRAAIVSVLSRLLADRIINQPEAENISAVWGDAVGSGVLAGSQLPSSGKLNRMIHVAIPGAEQIRPSGWGAVVKWPDPSNTASFKDRFGIDQPEFLCSELKIADTLLHGRCTLRLVRVGAACDHAQFRSGPLQYLLGVEIPEDVRAKHGSLPASVWQSPKLQFGPESKPFVLAVNTRFAVSVTQATANEWHAQYRLREQLLMHLITYASDYQARPGIVSL